MGWVYPSIGKKMVKFGKKIHGGYQKGSCKKFQHTLRNFFTGQMDSKTETYTWNETH